MEGDEDLWAEFGRVFDEHNLVKGNLPVDPDFSDLPDIDSNQAEHIIKWVIQTWPELTGLFTEATGWTVDEVLMTELADEVSP